VGRKGRRVERERTRPALDERDTNRSSPWKDASLRTENCPHQMAGGDKTKEMLK
jgi:hypothetical protein